MVYALLCSINTLNRSHKGLQPDIENPLEDLVKKLDRSKSYLINQAVREFPARNILEEQRWVETIEAIDSVKSGQLIEEKTQ